MPCQTLQSVISFLLLTYAVAKKLVYLFVYLFDSTLACSPYLSEKKRKYSISWSNLTVLLAVIIQAVVLVRYGLDRHVH